jgi:hypothetical protein
MRLDRGPMRAASPDHLPDSDNLARRPRGLALIVGAAFLVAGLLGAAPAAASEIADPQVPQPVLILGECDATLSIVQLVPGRAYDVTVTDASGAPLFAASGLVASSDVLDSFVTVPAGSHSWWVADSAAPEFSASREIVIAPCVEPAPEPVPATEPALDALSAETAPGVVVSTPTLSVEPLTCNLLGTSDLRVTASSLPSGGYTVGVTAGGSDVSAPRTLSVSSNSVVFADLTNGGVYEVWLKDTTGTTVATATITMPICDLPTLGDPLSGTEVNSELDKSPRELAATGLPVVALVVAGVGILQGGALLAGIGFARRRD